ncbi:MAG: HesB/IscA family protein [Methyloligellaceae bacterium]
MPQKPKILTLTDAAAERIKQIIASVGESVAGVRVGVKNAGCVGMEYTLEFVETADPQDDVVEDKGARLFIDPKAILFLLGTTMDYQVDRLSSGFVFDNPNQTDVCGCGESVAITPASQAQLDAFDKPVQLS